MRLILVDIGNSAIKIKVLPESGSGQGNAVVDFSAASITTIVLRNGWDESKLQGLPTSDCHWLIASVADSHADDLVRSVKSNHPGDRVEIVSHQHIELPCHTDSLTSTGIDRLVAATAARSKLQVGESAIVVDAGTAVTIDLVDHAGFHGGVIYPGCGAAFKQLSDQTDALPDLDYQARQQLVRLWAQQEAERAVGCPALMPWMKNTQAAIAAGVFRLQLAGLENVVADFVKSAQRKSTATKIFLTGGGLSELLSVALLLSASPDWLPESEIFPDLVFEGLWQIHQ